MTIFELFNRDERNLPKKIKYIGSEFKINEIGEYVNDYGYTLFEMINSVSQIHDEIEILDNETDEIEELKIIRNLDNNKGVLETDDMHYTIRVVDEIIINKMNELVKSLNKIQKEQVLLRSLNKISDWGKETNCMSD